MPAIGGTGQRKKSGIGAVVVGQRQTRQTQNKAGGFVTARRIEADIAALQMSQAPGDRQPHAAPTSRRTPGIERIKQMRTLGHFRPWPVVLDGHLDGLALGRPTKHQTRPTVGGCRLDGVTQQAGEREAELGRVGVHRQSLRLEGHLNAHAALRRHFTQGGSRLAQKCRQINPPRTRRSRFGKLHQVAQDAVDPARLRDDRLQRLAWSVLGLDVKPVVFVTEQVLGLPGDNGERIVDLVAGTGGKLSQGRELARLQTLSLAMHLIVQRAMQGVNLLFQMIVQRLFAESPVVGGLLQQIA